MVGKPARRRTIFTPLSAAVLLAVAACTPVPVAGPDTASNFPRHAAGETVAEGYSRIVERYLDILTAEAAAMEGLRGLATIDPALTVDRHDGAIDLKYGDRIIGTYATPVTDDIGGWATLTVDITETSRSVSRGLRAASVEKIYEAVFDGSLSQLDIFSRYAGAAEAQEHRAKREGFGGIGVAYVVGKDVIRITRVIGESPASDSGLKIGDLIVGIDGVPTVGMSTRTVINLLRGPIGSRLSLAVRGPDDAAAHGVELVRSQIVPNTVTVRRKDGILLTAVSTFNQSTASNLAKTIKAAMQPDGEPVTGIILDLRGNPGGLLKQAVRVVDLFLAEGDIVDTRGRHPDSFQQYEATGRDITNGLPLIVLIDGRSASASEIVAAALQDQGRAVIVGTTSFGKGTVQTVIHMPNDGEITLTWSRLISPSGYVLHGLGVRPHICTSGIGSDGDAAVTKALALADNHTDLFQRLAARDRG